MIVHVLMHFSRLLPGDVPNTQDHSGKRIGTYTREGYACTAMKRLANTVGFVDRTDNFRLFTLEVDRTHWNEGFLTGPDGADVALADDPSGINGNDDGVVLCAGDTDRDVESERRHVDNEALFNPRRQLWSLERYKIGRLSALKLEDMGQKLVGLYSTRAKVSEAIGRLRARPGFAQWPDGFRINREPLNRVAWECGFVPWSEA
jgi:hypothetical protein